MIGLMHEAGGYLVINDRQPSHVELARQVGATARDVKVLLEELRGNDVFSVAADGIIYCRRMVRAAQRSATNSGNGKSGADARWGRKRAGDPGPQRDHAVKTDGDHDGEHDVEKHGLISLLASELLDQDDHEEKKAEFDDRRFERVQKAYPTKIGKKAARKEWDRIKPPPNDAVADRMVAAIKLQKRTVWSDTEVRYIPHLRTWLHQARWEDEVAAATGAAAEDSDLARTDQYLEDLRGVR
jgi:hypothetical protein